MSDSVWPHRRQPTRLLCPWDSPGKNAGMGCHFLLQCMKVKSESEVVQSCLTLRDPMDCSLPGSSVHGSFQARVLEWVAIAFSRVHPLPPCKTDYSLFLMHANPFCLESSKGTKFMTSFSNIQYTKKNFWYSSSPIACSWEKRNISLKFNFVPLRNAKRTLIQYKCVTKCQDFWEGWRLVKLA